MTKLSPAIFVIPGYEAQILSKIINLVICVAYTFALKQKKTMNTINKYDGNKVLFTSDTHFNHANILKFCDSPFKNIEDMNEILIANWNKVVGINDDVSHLGDFCLGGAAEWTKMLDRLNGKIHLIVGNHSLKDLRQGFVNRFEEVVMQRHIVIDKHSMYLMLYPFLCFSGSYKDDVWQLFGHVRTRKNNTGIDANRLQYPYPTLYDVGADDNNFTPVSCDQVRKIIEKQLNNKNE